MKLVVGNLPSAATEADVRDAFGKFGLCQIQLEGSRAFVTYDDTAHADAAQSHLHQFSLLGSQITVETATESPRKECRERSRSRSPPKAPSTESPPRDSVLKSPAKPAADSPPRNSVHQSPAKPSADTAPLVTDSSEQGQSPAKQDGAPSVPAAPTEEPAKAEEAKAEPGEEVCADDGSHFKIESVNKKNEELSQWKCLSCNKVLQKKSVKAHITTKTHKQHVTN